MNDLTLKIAADFSSIPGPRTKALGLRSGEEFRERVLEPRFLEARKTRCKLIVDLDGTVGYASSFLEEAFGGLARKYGESTVQELVEIRATEEPYLVDEVRTYIRDAKKIL